MKKEDYWRFLCAAIKMSVNNPQNFMNQYQTSIMIPKVGLIKIKRENKTIGNEKRFT